MQVDLDLFEMSWLLDSCLRGSHLKSGTIERFVDVWFKKFTEQERYNLYEWSLRLTYSYGREFQPSDTCCGADIAFMCRYDPENQYIVTANYQGEISHHRTFLYNGKYHISCSRFVADEYITNIEKYVPDVERTDFEQTFTGRRH